MPELGYKQLTSFRLCLRLVSEPSINSRLASCLCIVNVAMSSLNPFLLIVVLMLSVVSIVISQESCSVCNCQFSNIQVLDQLIEAKLNTALTGKI